MDHPLPLEPVPQGAVVAVEDLVGELLALLEVHPDGVQGKVIHGLHAVLGEQPGGRLVAVGPLDPRNAGRDLPLHGAGELDGRRRGVQRLGQIHGDARRHQPVQHPDAEEGHQRGPRRPDPRRHGEGQRDEDREVRQVAGGQHRAPRERRGGRARAAEGDRGAAHDGRRNQQQREGARHPEGLAEGQVPPGDPGSQELPERALFTLPGKRAESEQDDQQWHQVLEDLRRRERAEPLAGGGVLRRAHEEVVLAVGFQPDGSAGVGIDSLVEERQGKTRLEGVDAVVGRRVGILLPLGLPVVASRLPGRGVGGLGPAGLDQAAAQRDEQQHAHDGRAPAEAAVPEQVGELLSDDVADHCVPPTPACGRGRCARDRRGRSRRCSVR